MQLHVYSDGPNNYKGTVTDDNLCELYKVVFPHHCDLISFIVSMQIDRVCIDHDAQRYTLNSQVLDPHELRASIALAHATKRGRKRVVTVIGMGHSIGTTKRMSIS